MRISVLLMVLLGCGGGSNPGEDLYLACSAPEDCEVPDDVEPVCLDKSGEGFCTWGCAVDDDCAEASDEDVDFICASFESESDMHCFPSCEDPSDADNPCPSGFECRSTGGGSDNRKVCFPNDQ
jgi:hypothetical protein